MRSILFRCVLFALYLFTGATSWAGDWERQSKRPHDARKEQARAHTQMRQRKLCPDTPGEPPQKKAQAVLILKNKG